MFGRIFKYQILQTIRAKDIMFWSLLFPIILGTLFHAAFGNFMNKEETFHTIPVAYVGGEGQDDYFKELLEELAGQENPLVKVTRADDAKAKKLLEQGKVEGFFSNGESLSLTVKEEGISQSILKMVLDEYEKKQSAIQRIAEMHPENLKQALEGMDEGLHVLKEEDSGDKNMDALVTYFYALLAMSCLYGSFMGLEGAIRFKANLSDIGTRRVVTSTNRFLILLADVSAKILLQFLCTCIALAYLTLFLKVDFGSRLPQILLVILTGSVIGVMTGMFIGSLGRGRKNLKTSISVAITMLECFLSGLVVQGMYYLVETYVPIINRINPAALIVDAFHSLNLYVTFERFTKNILSLWAIAILLCIGSYLAVRRERYASI